MNEILEAALQLRKNGVKVVPVFPRSKRPMNTNWNNVECSEADLRKHLKTGDENIGVVLGDCSDGLIDIDIDHQIAVDLAPYFLPPTKAVFGRQSNRRSHYIYRAQGMQSQQYKLPDGQMLIEIRANSATGAGKHTVWPPSIHHSGEIITWEMEGEASHIEIKTLQDQVGKVAAASLLVINWPAEGTRHDTCLALAGTLLRSGWDCEETTTFIQRVCQAAGDQRDGSEISNIVSNTNEKLDRNEAVTGFTRLGDYIGQDNARKLMQILTLRDSQESEVDKKQSHSDLLLAILQGQELFHDGNEGYIRFDAGDHFETWPIKHPSCKDWLTLEFHKSHHKIPATKALQQALDTASSISRLKGTKRKVHMRVAELDGIIYVDLCDELWRVVKIGRHGWSVVTDSPVRFRRGNSLSLPEPLHGGDVELLRNHLNVQDDDDFVMLLGFVLASFQPNASKPILFIEGVAGSAKTTALRHIRSLIDPCKAPGRGLPRTVDDIYVAAKNNYLVSGDNCSGVSTEIADALCTLSTGGGISKRKLYTDDEEHFIEALRPCAVTGINLVSERQDVLDRAFVVRLSPISSSARRTEHEVFSAFANNHGLILGAVFDLISSALRNRANVKLTKLPRLADAAVWIEAAGQQLGWENGRFVEAHAAMQARVMEDAARGDLLCRVIWDWLDYKPEGYRFVGSATLLHTELSLFLKSSEQGSVLDNPNWPSNPTKLGKQLKRSYAGLTALGIEIHDTKDRNKSSVYHLALDPGRRSPEPQVPVQEECPF